MSKVCINCGSEKEINDFYKHNKMSDGYLNKCKTCCKDQAIKRTRILSKDNEWVLKQRKRSVDKYHRLNYKDKQKKNELVYPWKKENKYKGLRKWYESRYGLLDPLIELHHWSYKDENLRDVILLNRSTHKRLHSKLEICLIEKCFKIKGGPMLDTKEKHEEFIRNNIFDLN